jgi:molecular chaperone GrpE
VLTDLLPVVDDFERAMANLPEDTADQPWLEGVQLIQRKFQKLLDDYDVVVLDPAGEPFDPNLHQAIGTDDDSDADSGTVTETLQKGYMSGDRVLRPALVKVAS